MASSLVAALCATSRVLLRRLWCLSASSCATVVSGVRLGCSAVSARPETLGGRRAEYLVGADELPVSAAFASPLRVQNIDLGMLRGSGMSDRGPPVTGV